MLITFVQVYDTKVAWKKTTSTYAHHCHQVGTRTQAGTEVNLHDSSDRLMCSELGYCAHSLISGLNDGAATLTYFYISYHVMETDK